MKILIRFLMMLACLTLLSSRAMAWPEEDRTANRNILGEILYPQWLTNLPEHYEFTPLVSNFDPHHQHPAQWAGQDWDPALWNKDWTPEIAVKHFFQLRIFDRQYVEKNQAVLETGPMFYKISDLDRRRTLKLLADTSGVFGRGYKVIILRDWYTKDTVGNYTEKGMHLL